MRRVIGPFLTTGVALVAAGVVVANPIMAPRADVQIPAVKLSAGNDATVGMLDQAFLDAIGPAPSESDNPFSVLKRLITALAADATSMGKDVIVDAFVAGVAAVSQPELTAASIPYVGPPVDLPALTEALAPGFDVSVLIPAVSNIPAALPDSNSFVINAVAPVVQDIWKNLVADAGYVGSGLVAAAFAAGAVVAAEPGLIADTVRALVRGDLHGALQNAVNAVVAPLGPPGIILDTLRTLVDKHLGQLPSITPVPAVVPAAGSLADVTADVTADLGEAPSRAIFTGRETRRHRSDAAPLPVPAAASVSGPAAALGITARSESTVVVSPRKAGESARDALKAIGEQAGSAVGGLTDTVGKITGRARGGQAASAGDRG